MSRSIASMLSALSIRSSSPASIVSTDSGNASSGDDQEELELLGHSVRNCTTSESHELQTAPVFTRKAYIGAGAEKTFPHRGLLGSVVTPNVPEDGREALEDVRLYVNTNAPMSTLVCGVQGSGKSHTVSVLLENMLVSKCTRIGKLRKPLSGLVLHFGDAGADTQPSEAAYLGCPLYTSMEAPRVVVYVAPSSLARMRTVYAAVSPKITVEPLLFSDSELDAQAFLSLMAIGTSEAAPLYMQTLLAILREMGDSFTYDGFIYRLEAKKRDLNPAQHSGLKQRMELFETFLRKDRWALSTPPRRFASGQLTIVDLSDIFIDPHSACGLFAIVTRLFVRAKLDTGKVLVVDEAHKYLTADKREIGLTKALSSLVRQQRHEGLRVIISTQEPNVVPDALIDLCSVVIMHRFSSPTWWDHMAKHVSTSVSSNEAFDKVVRLKTGEAIVLAPSGLADYNSEESGGVQNLDLYGRRWISVKTRRRVTKDGGASILAVGKNP